MQIIHCSQQNTRWIPFRRTHTEREGALRHNVTDRSHSLVPHSVIAAQCGDADRQASQTISNSAKSLGSYRCREDFGGSNTENA